MQNLLNLRSSPPLVLLVEDNPADATLFRLAAAESGVECSVIVAESVEDATLFLRGPAHGTGGPVPQLIVLDWNLSGLNGQDLLQQLKTDSAVQHIPVVVFSSSDRKCDVDAAYDLYANGWVVKPVILDSYLETVRSILRFWFREASLPLQGGPNFAAAQA